MVATKRRAATRKRAPGPTRYNKPHNVTLPEHVSRALARIAETIREQREKAAEGLSWRERKKAGLNPDPRKPQKFGVSNVIAMIVDGVNSALEIDRLDLSGVTNAETGAERIRDAIDKLRR